MDSAICGLPQRVRRGPHGFPQSGDPTVEARWKPAGVSSTTRARPSGPNGPSGFPSKAISTAAAFPTRTVAWRENSISSVFPPGRTLPARALPSAHAQIQLAADVRTVLECARAPGEAADTSCTSPGDEVAGEVAGAVGAGARAGAGEGVVAGVAETTTGAEAVGAAGAAAGACFGFPPPGFCAAGAARLTRSLGFPAGTC